MCYLIFVSSKNIILKWLELFVEESYSVLFINVKRDIIILKTKKEINSSCGKQYFINFKSYIYVSIQVNFKYAALILVNFLSYIQRSYLRGLKELIGPAPAGFAFGLSGGCSYGFSSRAEESARVVLLSNG